MPTVRLQGETDFEGWRDAARRLRANDIAPEAVSWSSAADGELFAQDVAALPPGPGFAAPAGFVALARDVVLHRSPQRWDLLYRLLWRLREAPRLLALATDEDVAQAEHLRREVSKASHKMKAFVRFRQVPLAEGEAFAAWFEPPHRVVEKTAPFFVRRFATMRFSILTPDLCAHWDGETLAYTPGEDRASIPAPDALEEAWTLYYASIFNPARLKVAMMRKEMPQRYWRNLPEAALIPQLVEQAAARTAAMVQAGPTTPRRKLAGQARDAGTAPPQADAKTPSSLGDLAQALQGCRRCDLWRGATQAVPGEGPAEARLMLVGEQPGDQEDLAGTPFVGPAGEMLNRALDEAGVAREAVYLTNAVKHFKHELRGKRRLHKTPQAGGVRACRWWLDRELELVRPRVVLALGATAAGAVLGRATPILKARGRAFPLEGGAEAFVTVHPSYLLRLPDKAAREAGFALLVEDLRTARVRADDEQT